MRAHPAVGWVRADQVANTQLLTELNDLRKRFQKLQSQLAEASRSNRPIQIDNLAGLDESVELSGHFLSRSSRHDVRWKRSLTWAKLFGIIAPYLLDIRREDAVKRLIDASLPNLIDPRSLSEYCLSNARFE